MFPMRKDPRCYCHTKGLRIAIVNRLFLDLEKELVDENEAGLSLIDENEDSEVAMKLMIEVKKLLIESIAKEALS